MSFKEFLVEAKKGNKKEKLKHKTGKGIDRLKKEIEGRIGALKDNWEAEEFEKEILPHLDKAGPVDELGPRGAVKLFLALTRCYFYAKYPTSTDPISKIKVGKEPNVDDMLRQVAHDLVAYGQSKYPKNQEFDDLITDYEYGYIDDINTESLIALITEVIAFIS